MTHEIVNEASDLANRSIKNLTNKRNPTSLQIYSAVLMACTENADLVDNATIDEAHDRVMSAIKRANRNA